MLFPGRFGGNWEKIPDEKHLLIHFSDFELLLDAVGSVYPLLDIETGEVQECFEVCGMNSIHAAAWSGILERIRRLQPEDEKQKAFLHDVADWLVENLSLADGIMVNGTL